MIKSCRQSIAATAVKAQDISQEEILLMNNSNAHFRSRAMIVKSQN